MKGWSLHLWAAVSLAAGMGTGREASVAQAGDGAAVDTAEADPDITMGARCGEAPGQTFVAEDTLIRSISVWRLAAQTPYGGHLKLWITEVDSIGRPVIERVLLEGPVITVPFGDGVHPIKMEFTLEPPFALPRRGQFFFAVQDFCGGHWSFLTSTHDAYHGGHAWRSGIGCFEGCTLRPFSSAFESYDLAFTIDFRGDLPLPPRQQGWKQLKKRSR